MAVMQDRCTRYEIAGLLWQSRRTYNLSCVFAMFLLLFVFFLSNSSKGFNKCVRSSGRSGIDRISWLR